jgi:hypothetical protein
MVTPSSTGNRVAGRKPRATGPARPRTVSGRRARQALCAVLLLLLVATGCGDADQGRATTSTVAPAPTATTSNNASPQTTAVPSGGGDANAPNTGTHESVEADETTTSAAPTTAPTTTTEAPLLSDDMFAELDAIFENGADLGEPIDVPPESLQSRIGCCPDEYTAAAITLGLEQAGVDLTGIEVAVLPVTGGDTSLLVLEVGDDSVAPGLLTETAGSDMSAALLALPEIEGASITQLVLVYRGTDEEGSFVMTFVVPIDALRDAYASGGDVGDALRVQIDRGL